MSGGEYNYFYLKVLDFCEQLQNKDTNPKRAALAELLTKMAEELRIIEWADSGDCSEWKGEDAIDNILKGLGYDPALINKLEILEMLLKQEREGSKITYD
jgi:hypothetical protein